MQIDKLQASFHQWERTPSDIGERVRLTKELLASCESLDWQVSVGTIRRTLEESGAKGSSVTPSLNGVHQELMRLPNDYASMAGRSGYNTSRDDDDFISSESDRQLLLIK
ncbi:hypothetical protein B296_00036328 [Ensete ventricosum]|uniref:Syntaxin 6 N-terminal domain-containing protein n=1 Tax=Ensete ventricosum TaxID=4639 RepID=A0A426Z8D0_ENSVE|nr:hypothetical protein B296_00036328 [Ensete ventricosum]